MDQPPATSPGSPAGLDAHEQPPDALRAAWKDVSRLQPEALLHDDGRVRIDDPRLPLREDGGGFAVVARIAQSRLARAFARLAPDLAAQACADARVLAHPLVPGLLVVPSLVPPAVQAVLLDRLLLRDLSDPRHQTNLHLHYELPYPAPAPAGDAASRSLFALAPDAPAIFRPRDPAVHKPLSARQALHRRLHWLTLGGQYDWTDRVYPAGEPPAFPPDLARFLEDLFPETRPEAAIVNLYSPGDTMMMHRDVSEDTDRGLVSLSLGCDGLFMIAPSRQTSSSSPSPPPCDADASESGQGHLLLRLRSGDAVYMTKESRYAWHGVPKVLRGTCPGHLEDWPARDALFGEWQGWMKNKRINFNVRQIRD